MRNVLVIIGASGHGKVVADIAVKMNKYDKIYFLDDDEKLKETMNIPVIGRSSEAEKYIDKGELFVAIGNSEIRKKLQDDLMKKGALFASLIHPNATIGTNSSVGEGSVIMAGAVINPETRIGRGCIINTCASVDHDCSIADYVHVSVGVHIAGEVTIGTKTWIGAGATIVNNVNVADTCIIGAGAVVVEDIVESGIYVGVPAKRIEKGR